MSGCKPRLIGRVEPKPNTTQTDREKAVERLCDGSPSLHENKNGRVAAAVLILRTATGPRSQRF
jgi:hypothetical protein